MRSSQFQIFIAKNLRFFKNYDVSTPAKGEERNSFLQFCEDVL